MKNILRNATLSCLVTLASLVGCNKQEEQTGKDSLLPEIRKNQSLILHPDYLSGNAALGYTLLTDIDGDGSWDLAEKVHGGFTTGDYSKRVYFKKGFGPAQSVDVKVEIVEPDFFKSYE